MKKTALIFIALTISICAQSVNRLENSPYPASTQPDTLYKIFDKDYDQSELLTIGTLQGLLAKTKPKIYRISSDAYEIWLNDFVNNYGVKLASGFDPSLEGIVTKFKAPVEGYVLCDLEDGSVNAAISLCGIKNCIAVTSAHTDLMDTLGIPQYADVRGKDETWFAKNYGSEVNKNIFCFQDETKSSFLADYAAFGGMMDMYFSEFNESVDTVFSIFNPDASILGWGPDEHGTVEFASKHSASLHAADWANNLSTLTNFNVPDFKQPDPPVHKPDRSNVHTVCFLMSDGDNVQWSMNDLYSSSKWYGSDLRGHASIGWTIAPAMSELTPTILKSFYSHAAASSKGTDNFVAGPSGVGYMFPDKFPALSANAARTNAFMKKADLKILNIIGDSDDDKYLSPFLSQPDIDAIFFYFYSNYSGGNGQIKWVNNKPVIYGRFNLWDLFETPSTLPAKINDYPTSAWSKHAYSLIPVHVWSMTVQDVLTCINRFDDNVQVVTPEEFVALIRQYLISRTAALSITPDGLETETQFLVPGYEGTGVDSVARWADKNDKIAYRFNLDSLLNLVGGDKRINISISVSHEYVFSVGPAIDSLTKYGEWNADTTVAAHTDSNKAQYTIDVEKYIDKGWKDLYIVLEDGKKSDAYGAMIHKIIIKAPGAIGVEDDPQGSEIPQGFSLKQNYPNPFNPETQIEYNLKLAGTVQLDIYDTLGRLVKTLVNDFQSQGTHTITWDGSNNAGEKVTSGIYIYKLNSGGFSAAKKMVMLR